MNGLEKLVPKGYRFNPKPPEDYKKPAAPPAPPNKSSNQHPKEVVDLLREISIGVWENTRTMQSILQVLNER